VRVFESRRRDGRATFELELILRTTWVSLVTGGVILDMLQPLSVEMYADDDSESKAVKVGEERNSVYRAL
jgi:hypothetical protein